MLSKVLPILLEGLLWLWNPAGHSTAVDISGQETIWLAPGEVRALPAQAGLLTIAAENTTAAWTMTPGARIDALAPRRVWRYPIVPDTGLAIANPGPRQVTVALRINAGAGSKVLSLGLMPGAIAAQSVNWWLDIPAGVRLGEGSIVIDAEAPIIALAASCPAGLCSMLPAAAQE